MGMWVGEMVWRLWEIKNSGCFNEFELRFLSTWVLLNVPTMGVAIDDNGQSVRFRSLCRSSHCLLDLIIISRMVAPSCKGGWYTWSVSWEYCHQEYIPGSLLKDKREVGYWVITIILGCRGKWVD